MLLFIDTETTGLTDFDLPLDHPVQPRIVELAAQLCEEDGEVVATVDAVIRPDGWEVGESAAAIHGITTEHARAIGASVAEVLTHFDSLVTQCDADDPGWARMCAHNFNFDNRMLLIEYAHARRAPNALRMMLPFCTMRALTPRIKLPSRRGRPGEYKWPTLDEAYRYCFGLDVPSEHGTRHRAMADLRACKDIYFFGRAQGWWN